MHEQQRHAYDREPSAEEEPHREACRQPAGNRGDDEGDERERQEDDACLHGRVAEHALEVQRQEEELREHPGRDREGRDLRAGEGRHAEEPEVEHRRLAPQLDERKGDEQDGCGNKEADHATARPAPVVAAQ
jgi:hypothetical protein